MPEPLLPPSIVPSVQFTREEPAATAPVLQLVVVLPLLPKWMSCSTPLGWLMPVAAVLLATFTVSQPTQKTVLGSVLRSMSRVQSLPA